jgi:hypothetical protein
MMSDATDDILREEPVELESMPEELEEDIPEDPAADDRVLQSWKGCYLGDPIPCLLLDRNLRILNANDGFCRIFGCEPSASVPYFTQFFSPYFDEKKSSELFRAIRSRDAGYSWQGKVERLGTDQLLNVSKVWILPLGASTLASTSASSSAAPLAYRAVCLDYTTEHRRMQQDTFTSLLGAARLKDNDTGNHIERVNQYARILAEDIAGLAQAPDVDREFVQSIGLVSALHDVGKIGTPDDILNKAGELESWEWDVMKQHTTNGAYILSTYANPMAREIALRHHERWDGTGYPHGLAQDLIPLSARIVAVADVYDALRMRRTYKDAYPHEKAVANMTGESGTHFDPFVIERFLGISDRFREIYSELADSQ